MRERGKRRHGVTGGGLELVLVAGAGLQVHVTETWQPALSCLRRPRYEIEGQEAGQDCIPY